eukprot:TRINITY_DN12090_c0_g1_i1.p1 TRINITY_DN12090_c0_g1~~TRINITY_DN12090_c0_g1_i1.p1  ORF type:complete len:163 (-),score=2.78 TRINITY_DN12090_c0_g1_i1:43-531(-)
MSRFVRALRDLGIYDANAIDVLTPHVEAFYAASAKLQRALGPYGGTDHAVLIRASAPSHDPDADEVHWVTTFDKLGLFNIDDRYTSRMVDAFFRSSGGTMRRTYSLPNSVRDRFVCATPHRPLTIVGTVPAIHKRRRLLPPASPPGSSPPRSRPRSSPPTQS